MQSIDTRLDQEVLGREFCPRKQKGPDDHHGYSLQILRLYFVTFYIYSIQIHSSCKSPGIVFLLKVKLYKSKEAKNNHTLL